MRVPHKAAIAAVLVLSGGLLAGCGASEDPATGDPAAGDERVELTFWARGNSIPTDSEAMLAAQFPDYDITWENIPDIEDKLRAALRSQSGLPDVVIMGSSLPSFFTVADQFLDLSGHTSETGSVEWGLGVAEAPDGRQIGLPTDVGPWGFFYRADALEELGYPGDPAEVEDAVGSWEQYRELAEAAAANGQFVCDHAGQVYQSRIAQNGYAYFERSGDAEVNIVDSPISHDAFLAAAQLAQDGLCANAEPYTPEFNAALTQESIIGFIGPAWEDGLLKSAGELQTGSWRVATVPGGPAATAGSFVAALAASAHPEAAAEVAAYIAGAEFQRAGYLEKGLFPGAMGVYTDPEANAPQDYYGGQVTFEVFANAAENAPAIYLSPESGTVSAQFFVALNDLATNGQDPEQVYRRLVEQNAAS